MCYKGNIKSDLQVMMCQIATMKNFFWVPILYVCVLQPIYVFLNCYVGYGIEPVYICDAYITVAGKYYPIFSVCWSLWILKFYLEEPNRELHYVYEKIKWKEIRNYLLLYLFVILIPIMAFSRVMGILESIYFYLWMCSICFLFNSVVYWFCYYSKSATIILLPLLLYTFFVLEPINEFTYRVSYMRLLFPVEVNRLVFCIIILIVGLVFVFCGKKANIKYDAY